MCESFRSFTCDYGQKPKNTRPQADGVHPHLAILPQVPAAFCLLKFVRSFFFAFVQKLSLIIIKLFGVFLDYFYLMVCIIFIDILASAPITHRKKCRVYCSKECLQDRRQRGQPVHRTRTRRGKGGPRVSWGPIKCLRNGRSEFICYVILYSFIYQ